MRRSANRKKFDSRSSAGAQTSTTTEDDGFARRGFGAEGGTRTPTGCPTRPSNVRVCQFRHFGEVRGRSIALSRATDNSRDALAKPRVERVANSLAEEIVREHRDEDGEARVGREP